MSSKSVVSAVLLIGLGIIFGVVMISSFKGVDVSYASQDVKLSVSAQAKKANPTLQALNDAFHSVANNVTPSVVYIQVKSKPQDDEEQSDRGNEFFHRFFGPDMQMPKRGPEVGSGSGILLTSNGYVLTNNHVVENAMESGIKVQLSDTREYNAKLIGTDKLTDLAVVKIDASDLQAAAIGNSDDVEVGHIVFAIGSPLGLKSTMTQGIVSALGRPLGIINDGRSENSGYAIENFIQTDAAVNPGNSGGPLVDINGSVVGVNSAIATTNARYQGYSFAIPINLAKKVATDIIKFGKARRGYIGVQIQTVDAVTAKAAGLEKTKGVIVQTVNAKSAGEAAGIEVGDIILSVDGKEVNSSNTLQTTVANYYPGDEVTLKIWRSRKLIEKRVTLKPREDENSDIVPAKNKRPSERDEPSITVSRVEIEKLGLTVKSLDNKTRKNLETDKGVLVENVEPLGAAQERGLNQGDVILSIGSSNGGEETINSPDQFEKSISRLKQGEAVMLRVKGANKTTRFVAIEMPK